MHSRVNSWRPFIFIWLSLFMSLNLSVSVSLSVSLFHCLSLCFIDCLSVSLSVSLFHCLSLCFIVCLSVSLSVSLFHCLYVCQCQLVSLLSDEQQTSLIQAVCLCSVVSVCMSGYVYTNRFTVPPPCLFVYICDSTYVLNH